MCQHIAKLVESFDSAFDPVAIDRLSAIGALRLLIGFIASTQLRSDLFGQRRPFTLDLALADTEHR